MVHQDRVADQESNDDKPLGIVGTKPNARLTDLQPLWQSVRARRGKDVRIQISENLRLETPWQRPRPRCSANSSPYAVRPPRAKLISADPVKAARKGSGEHAISSIRQHDGIPFVR